MVKAATQMSDEGKRAVAKRCREKKEKGVGKRCQGHLTMVVRVARQQQVEGDGHGQGLSSGTEGARAMDSNFLRE